MSLQCKLLISGRIYKSVEFFSLPHIIKDTDAIISVMDLVYMHMFKWNDCLVRLLICVTAQMRN